MDKETIKKYLANQLSPLERNAFEQQMEADPFLKEAVEGWEMEFGQDADAWEKTTQEMNEIVAQKSAPKSGGKIIPLHIRRYAIAASLIGILSLLSYRLFVQKRYVDEQAIYAAYFKPLTHPDGAVRGNSTTTADRDAVQAYEKEDYWAAVNAYQKLVEQNPRNINYQLFLGISLLSTNQPAKAIQVLEGIRTAEDFHDDIHWYLALAYIRAKDLTHAKSTLEVLAKEDNYYTSTAREILGKLDGKLASKEE